jgi:hypothetical protein
MRKRNFFLTAFLGLAVSMAAGGAAVVKTTARLVPDPGFGAGVNWNSVLPHYPGGSSHRATYKDFVRLGDGRFIVLDARTYNFFVFDADGKFVNRLWKKGRRNPGDLLIYNRPEWLSVWADKYLFVSELGVVRVFDLKGREIRHAVIDHTVDCLFPLSEDRVAVAGWVLREDLPNRYVAAVVDLKTGVETVVMDSIEKRPEKEDVFDGLNGQKKVTISFPHAQIRSFVRPTSEGAFLAGFSNWPEIEVFDKTGKAIRTFMVKTEPAAMEWDRIRATTPTAMAAIERANKGLPPGHEIYAGGAHIPPNPYEPQKKISPNPNISYSPRKPVQDELKKEESTDSHAFFSPRFQIQNSPYFYNLYIDQNGNLLVFYFPTEGKNPVFQVYSPAGEYIREVVVETGDYNIPFSPSGAGAVFADGYLYAMAEKKDAKEPSLQLMKFKMVEK